MIFYIFGKVLSEFFKLTLVAYHISGHNHAHLLAECNLYAACRPDNISRTASMVNYITGHVSGL